MKSFWIKLLLVAYHITTRFNIVPFNSNNETVRNCINERERQKDSKKDPAWFLDGSANHDYNGKVKTINNNNCNYYWGTNKQKLLLDGYQNPLL